MEAMKRPSFSFSAVFLLLLFLSSGNRVTMGQNSDCDLQSLASPGCNQDGCNNLCIQHFGKTGKFGPVYGVCFASAICMCRQC
ncbi:hypothetical protein E1A91_D04G080800v1 [Gossypium mustelinum]|uniref:Knottin scorpion toxin-like domain-containing protein n=1 Tax=Gossypium mustelinum TaxID=34275 RepID=A0A5D2VBE8_GOSMU|nr:hypothetical protein E1A91_D04G080800v1 [Gossypium mustelinum]